MIHVTLEDEQGGVSVGLTSYMKLMAHRYKPQAQSYIHCQSYRFAETWQKQSAISQPACLSGQNKLCTQLSAWLPLTYEVTTVAIANITGSP